MDHPSACLATLQLQTDAIRDLTLFRLTTIVFRMTTAQQVSDSLREVVVAAAKSAGKSQRDISDETGIPLTTVNRKFKGIYPMTVLELAAFADAIGTSITDLALKAERRTAGSEAA